MGRYVIRGFGSVAVYDRDGAYVGTITERLYGTFFIADWLAKGRALELDGTEGTPAELIKLLRAEGYQVDESCDGRAGTTG